MYPHEGDGKGEVGRQMEGSLFLHRTSCTCSHHVSLVFKSAKGKEPCIRYTDESLMWFHLPAGMLPSSVKT